MVEAGRSVVTQRLQSPIRHFDLRKKKQRAQSLAPPPYFHSAMNEFRGVGEIYKNSINQCYGIIYHKMKIIYDDDNWYDSKV